MTQRTSGRKQQGKAKQNKRVELTSRARVTRQKVRFKGMEFVLESGIDIPAPTGGRRPGVAKYPFAMMEVGQSFFLKIEHPFDSEEFDKEAKRLQSNLSGAVRRHRKVSGTDFSGVSRRVDDKVLGPGVRFWRTEDEPRTSRAARRDAKEGRQAKAPSKASGKANGSV